ARGAALDCLRRQAGRGTRLDRIASRELVTPRSRNLTMCGVGGAIGRTEDGALLERFAVGCLDANARRGPDYRAEIGHDVGRWKAYLAHNRLTILDLTARGNQPMNGPGGNVCITFNGEIYNHETLRRELGAQGRR